ncbi:MAG: hypothetical protein HY683_08195 [Chloroflexi bacterium]|nr:hypothetical protein [Chloroflexota bacterium]
MAGQRNGQASSLLWFIFGGFSLALFSLFGILAGYILGTFIVLALVLSPFVIGGIALIGFLTRGRVSLPLPAERRVAAEVETRGPVLAMARVVRTSGACPFGVQYRVGKAFTLFEGATARPFMCPPVMKALGVHVEQALRAQAVTGRQAIVEGVVTCPLRAHSMVFEVNLPKVRVPQKVA